MITTKTTIRCDRCGNKIESEFDLKQLTFTGKRFTDIKFFRTDHQRPLTTIQYPPKKFDLCARCYNELMMFLCEFEKLRSEYVFNDEADDFILKGR